MTLYDYCKQRKDDTLLREWDREANAGLSPRYVGTGSGYNAYWRCPSGHKWQKPVMRRVAGCGCPVCANRVVVKGVNDLATTNPELAAEWDWEKNGSLLPTEIVEGAQRKVWWRCRRDPGHVWQASVYLRAKKGRQCPYCAGVAVLPGSNDLATRFPVLAAQWYQPLNEDLTPEMVTAGSQKKVAWKCACGCVWYARIDARTRKNGTGCPSCAGQTNRSRLARYDAITGEAPPRRTRQEAEAGYISASTGQANIL